MFVMKRTRIGKSKFFVAATIACVLLALGGGLFTVRAAGSSTGPTLSAVSAQTLAAEGIALMSPSTSATVTESAAIETAESQFPGAQDREAVLAQVRDDHQVPALDRLCWVVSLVPPVGTESIGPPGSTPQPASYFVVFIDAQTGAFVFGTAGNGS